MKEFIINDFITLKLENDETFIYVKKKRFIQCIRLTLTISEQDSDIMDDIDSIDEASELKRLRTLNVSENPFLKTNEKEIDAFLEILKSRGAFIEK